MRKDLILHKIDYGTPEWYEFRKNGIGGSEVGTVLGINKYDTNVRLFHEKVGTVQPWKEDTERMFWGRTNEENIARIWQYYDGTKDGYVQNFANDKIVRKCRSVNGYIVNPEYPWLFASVDRLINKEGGFNLLTGEPLENEAILECKNMSYWASQMWEDGIPIFYLAQIHQYMAILDTNYAEIAMLVDGGSLVVEKLERNDQLLDRILSITKNFWYERVVPAKKALQNRDIAFMEGNIAESEKWKAEIDRLEPYPDDSETYQEFMNQKFLKERETIDGTMELYHLAKQDKFLVKAINKLKEKRTGIKNLFIRFLSQNGAESVDFGKLGYVNWSEKKGYKTRSFNNRIKETPDEERVEEEISKMDFNTY